MDCTYKRHKPWPHIIVDNFLSNYEWHMSQYELWRQAKMQNRMAKLPLKDLSRVPVLNGYLSELSHRPYNQLKLDWHYSVHYRGFKYPIHSENKKKILSVVVYLGEIGCGTDLYNADQTPWGEVEWKPNRAFIFAGQEGITWHSYRTGDHAVRTTLNGFLLNDI